MATPASGEPGKGMRKDHRTGKSSGDHARSQRDPSHTARDVRRRKAPGISPRSAEEKWQAIIDSAYEGICVVDETFTFTFANKRMAEMFGYEPEEFLGKGLDCFVLDEDLLSYSEEKEKLTRGLAGQSERRYRRKDGSILWAQVSINPMIDGDGRFLGASLFYLDITERKATEEALRASEEKCQRIVDTAYEGIPVVDENFAYTFVNKRMAEMFGYEPEEMLGKRLEDFVFEEDLPSLLERKERHRQGIAEQFERRYRRKDGSILWVLVTTNPVMDADGRFRGVFALYLDISGRKAGEQALAESEARYRALVETQVDAVCRWLPDTRLTFVNKGYCAFLGEEPANVIGRKWVELELNRGSEAALKIAQKLVKDLQVSSDEWREVDGEGRTRWFEWTSCPIFDQQGRLVEFQSVGRDVTRRKEAETELIQHGYRLEDVVRERTLRLAQTNKELQQDIATRKRVERALETKSRNLAEANTTLKVLLNNRDEDKKELEERVSSNVNDLVLRHVRHLRETQLDTHQSTLLDMIETGLKGIISPFLKTMAAYDFTHRELEVISLVREGKSTKEIARLLNVSPDAISFHRHHIRRKLGLNSEDISLYSHLLTLC
jgi:PAS domain S-box-containing protein